MKTIGIAGCIAAFMAMMAFNVQAEELYVCGEGCNLSSQARNIAQNTSPGNRFSIISVKNNVQAHTYEAVFRDFNGEPLIVESPVATTYKASSKSLEIEDWKDRIRNTDYTVPSHITNSTYDLVTRSYIRTDVRNWLEANHIAQLQTLGSSVLQGIGVIGNIEIQLKLLFSDGGTAIFKASGINGLLEFRFKFVEGSAKDASGNQIPMSAQDFAGQIYQFSGGGTASMQNLAGLYGVPVHEVQACSPTGEMTCTGSGDDIECEVSYQCP